MYKVTNFYANGTGAIAADVQLITEHRHRILIQFCALKIVLLLTIDKAQVLSFYSWCPAIGLNPSSKQSFKLKFM